MQIIHENNFHTKILYPHFGYHADKIFNKAARPYIQTKFQNGAVPKEHTLKMALSSYFYIKLELRGSLVIALSFSSFRGS